jgi:hypothetical protein
MRGPTESDLESSPLIKEVTASWQFADDAQRLQLCRLFAYLADTAYPQLAEERKRRAKSNPGNVGLDIQNSRRTPLGTSVGSDVTVVRPLEVEGNEQRELLQASGKRAQCQRLERASALWHDGSV